VRLTIVKPKKQKTPVAVGAEGAASELPAGEDLGDGDDLHESHDEETHGVEPDGQLDSTE
jgi:hypothetical protein